MTTPDDDTQKHFQAELQLTACQEEPRMDANKEYDVELGAAGMRKKLQAMLDVGVYDEAKINDSEEN